MTEETNVHEEAEADPIEAILAGECLSVSGRSTLTYEVGRHTQENTFHLRIADNTGKGMFCRDWVLAADIDAIVQIPGKLTAQSFQPLHHGRSINTGGFVLAALKDLGLIRANEENTRQHERVPLLTFEQVVMGRIGQPSAPDAKPGKRKGKGG